MKAEVILDTPFFKSVRMGSWICVYDRFNETSTWKHDSESEDPVCQCGHRIGSHKGGVYSCQICECGKFALL